MELHGFIQNLANQFDDVKVNEIKGETSYKNLEGYSSLIALSIIAMVDEEYNVRLKGDDIRNTETVEGLFNIVKSRI